MHRRTARLSVAGLVVVAFGAGAATAPASAGAAKLTKKKVAAIAAKVVDQRAATLKVSHAATADLATKATQATKAETADVAINADNATALGGQPAGAYQNSVLSVGSPPLYTTDPAKRVRFTLTGLPVGVSYLLNYNFAFATDPGAEVRCWVGFSNPLGSGATSGNTASTSGVITGATTVAHFVDAKDHEPQITCEAQTGLLRIADARTTTLASGMTLLKLDTNAPLSVSAETVTSSD